MVASCEHPVQTAPRQELAVQAERLPRRHQNDGRCGNPPGDTEQVDLRVGLGAYGLIPFARDTADFTRRRTQPMRNSMSPRPGPASVDSGPGSGRG